MKHPLWVEPGSQGYSAHLRMYPELIAEGYIFVLQDSRGRGASGVIRHRRPDPGNNVSRSERDHHPPSTFDSYRLAYQPRSQ